MIYIDFKIQKFMQIPFYQISCHLNTSETYVANIYYMSHL